jgi:hypothetical protein
MEAIELRLGNIVECEEDDCQVEGVHFIDENRYKILIGNHLRRMDEISPIPLSEKWLERMGFTIVPTPSAYGFDCNKGSEEHLLRGAWNGKDFYAL